MASKVVIYGGFGGIGSATGCILRSRGYDLKLVGRSEEKLSSMAAELGATYAKSDVTDAHLFSRVTDHARSPMNGLVYAVGTINLRNFERLTEVDFLNDFRDNTLCAAFAVQAALPVLKKVQISPKSYFYPARRPFKALLFMG